MAAEACAVRPTKAQGGGAYFYFNKLTTHFEVLGRNRRLFLNDAIGKWGKCDGSMTASE